jgi:spermidine synthase
MAIYWAKTHFYPPGVLPAFYGSGLLCLLIMMPVCLVSGGLFTLLADEFSKTSQQQKAQIVYGLEAVGSVAGGLLFTFVLIRFFSTFKIIFVVAAVNLFASLLLVRGQRFAAIKRIWIVIYIFAFLFTPYIIDLDTLSKSLVFKNQKIVMMNNTPYGSLIVTQTGRQFNFFENGTGLFSTDNLIANEESVHYAMIRHKEPKSVLVISGDAGGMVREILKYNVEVIDYVEINPYLIDAIKKFVGLPAEKLNIHVVDARRFITETKTKYDVVLLNLPPPASLQLNRFYTDEFFSRVKQVLNPGGIISIPVEGGSNYLGDEAIDLIGIIYKTLRINFTNVILYPGQSNYFLASDHNLSYEITEKLSKKKLNNEFVNSYYINDEQAASRAGSVIEALDRHAQVNRDFRPVAYFSQIGYWLSWYGQKMWWVIAAAALGLMTIFLFSKPPNKSLLVTGFSASVVEVVILLAFQIYFGRLYQAVALLISGFMVGLAAGVWFAEKKSAQIKFIWFIKNQGMIGVFSLLVLFLVVLLQDISLPAITTKIFFYISMLIFGCITGMQFSFAMKLQKRAGTSVSSLAYAADLLGAAGGAILASILLIPVLGLNVTALLIFGLNLLMTVILGISRKTGSY